RGPHCQSGNPPIKATSGTCPQSRALQVRRLRPTHCCPKTPLTATLQATPHALRLAAFRLRPPPGARLAANSPRLPSMSEILVPVSFGELLDKIAILQIKSERMSDAAKLANVRKELSALEQTWMAHPAAGGDIAQLRVQLKAVN